MTKDKHLIIGQMNDKNQAHGAALMIKTDGSLIREGSFQNGKQQGYGRHIWSEGYFIGDFKEFRYHGQGTCVLSNSIYVGAWENGVRHGPGFFTTA